MSVLSLRIDDDTKDRLDRLSALTRRPASVYVREALEEKIEELEDYYLAVEALQEYRKDPTTHSLEEVAENLGLEI